MGPSPRSIATSCTPAARNRRTICLNPPASWAMSNRSITRRPARPHTRRGSPTPNPPLPLVHLVAQQLQFRSTKPGTRKSALVLDAHCKALEARGPIASLQHRAAGSRGTPIGPQKASIHIDDPDGYRPSTGTHPRPPAHPEWISEHQPTSPLDPGQRPTHGVRAKPLRCSQPRAALRIGAAENLGRFRDPPPPRPASHQLSRAGH